MTHRIIYCLALLALAGSSSALAVDTGFDSLTLEFNRNIKPLVESHCSECHGSDAPEGGLDLTAFESVRDVSQSHSVWTNVRERVEAGEMPPEDAEHQLDQRQQELLLDWMTRWRTWESNRNAGDPGFVPVRRLSNAEYDYSIRDVTGVDIKPTATFPVDPANAAGFDNSGESLTMSPALMNKYLEAARQVADHLVFTPSGLEFAPHTVTTDTDRDKYCVKRIVEFYQRQPINLTDYFLAAWRFRHRAALGNENATLADVAAEFGISERYLTTVAGTLERESTEFGPLAKLQAMWQALPTSEQAVEKSYDAEVACARMRDFVLGVRPQFSPFFDNLKAGGIHKGSQAFVLWKNKQYANHRMLADFSFLEQEPSKSMLAAYVVDAPAAEDREQFEADCQVFCSVFPEAFFISERGRDYLGVPKDEQEKGRLLSAGFHSMMGYFRDDAPLMELLLSESQRQELDALWDELNFFAAAPQRQYQGLLWFERTDSGYMRDPEFDFARPEDKSALTEEKIKKLAGVYLNKAIAAGAETTPQQAILEYFTEINEQIRWVEQTRLTAEPKHLDAIVDFAERAYRRPLTIPEQTRMRDFYQQLRRDDELSHEEAIQDTLVSVLMSPEFCYRLDLLSAPSEVGQSDTVQVVPLGDYELASRLSYFLWSSVPDAELLHHAEAGDLHLPEVLVQQANRMLADPRVRGLATEFGANWLDVRRFEEHNSVDRQRFPSFDDQLRKAMFEEPIRFFMDVAQQNRSLTDFISAERTFVNMPLATHYGMSGIRWHDQEWVEVEDASAYGRGGLLPMAVFLTKNAPGLRTSPVKRGYWVVRRLLGERIPPPPPNVPELPSDETQLGELTLRETLAKHREHASCAVCHNRIDYVGLVFEGFGPVGERRQIDLGGRTVDAATDFPDGSHREGVDGLRQYLQQERLGDFVDNFNRKLATYALGRTLLLSDDALLQRMRARLDEDETRFSNAVEAIVLSPQFLNKRGPSPGG